MFYKNGEQINWIIITRKAVFCSSCFCTNTAMNGGLISLLTIYLQYILNTWSVTTKLGIYVSLVYWSICVDGLQLESQCFTKWQQKWRYIINVAVNWQRIIHIYYHQHHYHLLRATMMIECFITILFHSFPL